MYLHINIKHQDLISTIFASSHLLLKFIFPVKNEFVYS